MGGWLRSGHPLKSELHSTLCMLVAWHRTIKKMGRLEALAKLPPKTPLGRDLFDWSHVEDCVLLATRGKLLKFHMGSSRTKLHCGFLGVIAHQGFLGRRLMVNQKTLTLLLLVRIQSS